ncbi:FbpB family small basic protein [Geobacillus stearothermophilus]
MRRSRKMALQELISENKRQLLSDREALEKIEKKLEERMLKKAE